MLEAITTIWELANNPLVQLGGSALFALLLTLAGYTIATQPKAKDVAQDLADLSEELEPWVLQAEKALLRGEAKYSRVFDQAQAWLKDQGITGRRGRLIRKYLPGLIELSVKRMKERQHQADRQAS